MAFVRGRGRGRGMGRTSSSFAVGQAEPLRPALSRTGPATEVNIVHNNEATMAHGDADVRDVGVVSAPGTDVDDVSTSLY